MYAIQNGGQCMSGADAEDTYQKHGASTTCQDDGEGATWANQVYKITLLGEFRFKPYLGTRKWVYSNRPETSLTSGLGTYVIH